MIKPNPSAFAGTCALALALALSGCGGDIEARMAEVRALQDVGQYQASIDELRQILSIEPDLPEATYRLGVALLQTGEPSRAVWALEKATENPAYAIRAALLLASAHFSQQNFEASIRAADRALEIDPDQHAALRMRAMANVG
ncbi:MAG: tetratricopeptide repeat protein, partial [Myxococcota bacterium]|nr:tetratricopeptide repeat protein [Myxococcota bacterium]